MKKICLNCNNECSSYGKYCSVDCQYEFVSKKYFKQLNITPISVCSFCGKQLSHKTIFNKLRGIKKGYLSKDSKFYCSSYCKGQDVKMPNKYCVVCEKEFTTYNAKAQCCSVQCAAKLRGMKQQNVPKSEVQRLKMSINSIGVDRLKNNRGGNGRGGSVSENLLYNALIRENILCEKEKAISLGKKIEGYPTNYKVDIAITNTMIGIEIDGISHKTYKQKERDKKKEEKLCSLNWTILRFTNEEVQNIESCVQKIKSMI